MIDSLLNKQGNYKTINEAFITTSQGELLIPASVFIRILKGEFINVPNWEIFKEKQGDEDCIVFRNPFIVNGDIEIDGFFEFKYKIEIHTGVFKRKFIIKNSTFQKTFFLSGGVFENGFEFRLSNFYDLQINHKCRLNEKLSIDSKCNIFLLSLINARLDMSIQSGVSIGTLSVLSQNSCNLLIIGASINKIAFENIISKDTVISIQNSNIGYIEFNEMYNYGQVNFNDIRYVKSTKKIYDIKTGEFVQDEIISPKLLRIVRSDLGKMHFIDCDFRDAQFGFYSSKIADIFLAGTKFPNRIYHLKINYLGRLKYRFYSFISKVLTGKYLVKDHDYYNQFDQQRLGYGQLKKIYENRGDLIEARMYYSREMLAYWRTLEPWQIGEHILLFLNFISNGFSRYWLVGLLFTITVTHIFFGLYAKSLGYTFQFNEAGYQNYFKIFKFFSIVSDIELLDGKPTFWTYIWSLVGRLFIAFGIYQTIVAFRKHGRSGS